MEEFPSAIIQFVVSDVSTELLPRMPYARCRYVPFDLSKPPKPQGLDVASFDVITAFNVLHVVEDLAPSLAVLNSLLVPGGCLLIGDLNGESWSSRAPGSIWFDFIFGSFAEWFAFKDDRSHCTISSQDWHRRLHTAGFGDVYTAEFTSDPLLFTLEAQKSVHLPLDVSTLEHHTEELVIQYRQGTEVQVRDKLSALDTLSTVSLWFYCGSGFHGDAGIGFFKSLGREYPLWDIHLVVFDGPLNEQEQLEFVYRLTRIPGLEPLIRVDEQGAILVSRVIPSAAPSGKHPFQPSLPWTLTEAGLIQTSLVSHQTDLVTVEVLAMSRREANLRTFVGRVSSTVDNSYISANQLVVGLAPSQGISNFITAHHASLALLPDTAEELAVEIAGAALGILIGCLACGVSNLTSSRRRRGGRALLSNGSDVVSPSLKWVLRLLDFEVVEVKSNTPADLAGRATEVDFILSGSEDNVELQAITQALTRKCRIFTWNDSRGGLESILNEDPASIGEAFDFVIELVDQWPRNDFGLRLSDISIPDAGTHVTSSATLFDSNKAYLLVGGLGGLGIRVALWMYEVRTVQFVNIFR
jgi:Methyltransferase domain